MMRCTGRVTGVDFEKKAARLPSRIRCSEERSASLSFAQLRSASLGFAQLCWNVVGLLVSHTRYASCVDLRNQGYSLCSARLS